MRILLHYLLPLLLPTVIYIVYMAWNRRRAVAAGAQAPDWREGPIFWFALSGLVLVVLSLLLFAILRGDERSGAYVPPRVENGKAIPGKFLKRTPPKTE